MAESNITPEQYKQAIKNIDELYKKQKNLNQFAEKMKATWAGISTTIFGISGAEWFKSVPKTTKDIAQQAEILNEMTGNLNDMGKKLNKEVSEAITGLGDGAGNELKKTLKEFSGTFKSKTDIMKTQLLDVASNFNLDNTQIEDISKQIENINALNKKDKDELIDKLKSYGIEEESINKKAEENRIESKTHYEKLLGMMPELQKFDDENLKTKLLIALAEDDISGFLKENKEAGVAILSTNKKIFNSVEGTVGQFLSASKNVAKMEEELKKADKEVFSIRNGLTAMAKNMASGIITKLLEFDDAIHEAQRSTGIMFAKNSQAMTDLTIKTARFGMTIAQTTELMGTMSDTLNTTNFNLLEDAADSLAAVSMATGASTQDIGQMSAELMRFGKSAKELEGVFEDINVSAKSFGVNTRKTIELVNKNLIKFRTFGFQGGIESLTKMTNLALRLGQNVDEIFDMTEKTRTIEGAMELAAAMQLAGGSFASAANPMDLLSAARKGPEEIQKLLGKMGAEIGKFNAKGEFEIDPIDADRLRIVSQASGLSIQTLMNTIQKTALDNKKLKMFPDDMFSIKGLDSDAIKAQLSDAIEIGDDGQLKVKEGNIFGAASIDELKKMTKTDIENKLKQAEIDAKNLEKQAEQNMSLNKSMTAFKNAFMNILTTLQPVIDALTWVFQKLSQFIQWVRGSGTFGKIITTVVALSAALFLLIPPLIGALGKAAFAMNPKNLGGIFRRGGVGAAMNPAGGGGASRWAAPSPRGGAGGAGGAGGGGGLQSLAKGLSEMGGAKVLRGIGNTALAGPALLLLLPGMPTLALLGLIGLMSVQVIAGFNAVKTGFQAISKISPSDALKGGLVMALIGASLIPFAFALNLMSGVSWSAVIAGLGFMIASVLILMVLGAMVTGPQIIALLIGMGVLLAIGAMMLMVSLSLIIAAEGFNRLSKVDWGTMAVMGSTLMGLVGPLIAFSLAGLMFANPITMIGMLAMIGTLAMISLVLIPLAEALNIGSKGLDGMASGVLKLSDSLAKLDFEKLDKLKDFSSEMASAASSSAVIDSLEKLASAIGKVGGGGTGGAGGGGDKKIVVQLVLPNGGVIQEQIVNFNNKAG